MLLAGYMQWGIAHRSLFLGLLVSYVILQARADVEAPPGAWYAPPPPKLAKCNMGTPCSNPCNCTFPNACGQDGNCCPVDRPNTCGKKACYEDPLGAFSFSNNIPQGSCLWNGTLCPKGLAVQGRNTCCPVGLRSCESVLGIGSGSCYSGDGRCCTNGRVCPLGELCHVDGMGNIDDPICCSKGTFRCGRKCIREGTACCLSGVCDNCKVGEYNCANYGCIPKSQKCCMAGPVKLCCPFGKRACGSKCLSNNITCCPDAPRGTCPTGTFCGYDKKTCCNNSAEDCGTYDPITGKYKSYCAPAGSTCCNNKKGYCPPGTYCTSQPYSSPNSSPLCCKIGEKACGTKCVPATTRCCGDKLCKSGYCMAVLGPKGKAFTCCPLGKDCCPKAFSTACSYTSYNSWEP